MNKSSLKNIISTHLLVHKAFEYHDEYRDNIERMFKEYEEYLDKTCPKVSYADDFYGEKIFGREPKYTTTAGNTCAIISFNIPFDGSSSEPQIYDSYEEMAADNNFGDDDRIKKLKPREEYNDEEGMTVERDGYGQWIVQSYSHDIETRVFKVTISLDFYSCLQDGINGFMVEYDDDLKRYGFDKSQVFYRLSDAHNAAMKCIDDVAKNAMDQLDDFDYDKYQEKYDRSIANKEELFDPDNELQGHLNFESLKRFFGDLFMEFNK